MPPQEDLKVLVVGAGSCGLALAQGLKKHSIPYVLFERDAEGDYLQRPRDWGSLLHWGQPYLAKCLPPELEARKTEMYVDPSLDYESVSASLIWDGKTGAEITRPPSREGSVRVSRGKIRRLLSQGLDIQYNKRLSSIEDDGQKITAHFSDGSSATGDVLIGCDGAHSLVRKCIVGTEVARGWDSGYTMMNTWTTLPEETALAIRAKHPISSQAINNGPYGNLIALLDKPAPGAPPATWKYQVYAGWLGHPRKADLATDEKALEHFRRVLRNQAEPFKSVADAFVDGTKVPVDEGACFAPSPELEWDNHGGRLVIAGDAAHSMLPHRGQGLNNAVSDAAEIVDALVKVRDGHATLAEAVRGYEKEMRQRGAEEVMRSYEQMLLTAEGRFGESALATVGFNRVQK